MSTSDLQYEVENHVAVITLNRPAALNALTLGMLQALRARLMQCAEDPEIRALLLRGAGDRAFCAGGDIRALYQSIKTGGREHGEFFEAEYRLDFLLHVYPKPYVALMDGITMGGGMGLAQGSKLRIVGERTRIAMPEVGIGLFPDVGASYFLSRLPGALGPYLALTGAPIDGWDAIYCGLADVFLPPAAVAALSDSLATLRWTRNPVADVQGLVHARASQGSAPPLAALRTAIDTHFTQPSVEAIIVSLDAEARPLFAEWARRTADLMRSRSPTMLCVAVRQLQLGKSLDLADCFRMELDMVEQAFEQGDLVEGIRALIIDKDNAPRWQPSRLEEVTADSVNAFFRASRGGGMHPLANLGRIDARSAAHR